MEELIVKHLDEPLPCQWNLKCENIKKQEQHSKEKFIELVAEYTELNTLHDIFGKLANISISTLGFFSKITLYKINSNLAQQNFTAVSLVNLPPTIVSDMYVFLIVYGVFGDLAYKDKIISFEFSRSGTNFSLIIMYNLMDCKLNATIIESLYKFIEIPRFVEAYDPEKFQPSIDIMMKQPLPSTFNQKLDVKNTFDSAVNILAKQLTEAQASSK
ncbi:hypothetical protein TVAG_358190 [Trichomonas vaginalis G3]|uniref:Uncharacterized protein n=1 Tax=Trichomonas vaginalis (strain ATCC PRA-98 / G3) TaxID=412133 RepID=A2ELC7_TRIV3|nr:hypothetical protein TVAGG3_0274390 [Trichomonas vaginalis G3]EAY06529.1 hypothetical protein TVAG_358190 [Trichomonas vaginalis G3]KAI5526098.1 hypothetical protein TVAGG3_0274390 [Trichomonas vaginalis G3]|eukprot:XP_001318752.1 hypothetical protein [Trichomonas vaginalis G3]